jgi:hypothetical protein
MILRDQPPSTKLGDVARVGWRTALVYCRPGLHDFRLWQL